MVFCRYGLCPGFLNNPQDALPPECDQAGARCGEAVHRWDRLFNKEMVYASVMLILSAVLYLFFGSVDRVRYYQMVYNLWDLEH